MNSKKLTKILASHALWLTSHGALGECADLRGANLDGANLDGANLRGANLRWANLENVNLRGADLRGANLRVANLRGAHLRGADLTGADLTGANLRGASLAGAILRGAYLRWANLENVNLRGADLRGANLRVANLADANLADANLADANLFGANLRGVDLAGAILPENWQIVPPAGQSFAAFKKTRDGVVLEILIPGSAARTSNIIGRKCRANEALVVGVAVGDASSTGIYESLHCSDFTYEVGKMAREPAFNPDIRVECTTGIHFFLTKEEAVDYC